MKKEGIKKPEAKTGRRYFCNTCSKIYETRCGFDGHMRNVHHIASAKARSHSQKAKGKKGDQEHICPYCSVSFPEHSNLKRHLKQEVCITYHEARKVSPMRDTEDDKEAEHCSLSLYEKMPAKRIYSAKVYSSPKEVYQVFDAIVDTGKELNLLLPVYRISRPMYRWERDGSAAYRFGTQDRLATKKDELVFKSICSILDGYREIKIYSKDFAFLPPEMAGGYYCVMLFYGVRMSSNIKSTYLWIDENCGWEIQNRSKSVMYAAGEIKDFSHGLSHEAQQQCTGLGLKYASKKDFTSHSVPTETPWLSFAIDRLNNLPDKLSTLNPEQRNVAALLVKEINKVKGPYDKIDRSFANVHFINGLPGTGKSFLMESLYLYCRSQGVNCKVVAFTKMVANMYKEGDTIHSYFHIPFKKGKIEDPDTEANPTKGRLYSIVNLRVLFIDEICCIRKRLLDIVDECLRRLHNPNVPFGGLLVITAGDFNQLPPVNNNDEGSSEGVVPTESFSSMEFFSKHTKVYSLEIPCRVHRPGGDARLFNLMRETMTKELVKFDSPLMLKNLDEGIEFVYGDRGLWPANFLKGNAIICFTNMAAFEVNSFALSAWTMQDQNDMKKVLRTAAYSSRFESKSLQNRKLNKVHPPFLKEGMPLFCSKNTKEGLVNGSQVIYKGTSDGPRGGRYLFVTEINDNQTGRSYSVGTSGAGYPFDWGFALTVHKAQGRTFNRVCVVFTGKDEPFVHGQLTVALTRVRSLDDLRIVKESRSCKNPIDKSIKKVADAISKKALNKF